MTSWLPNWLGGTPAKPTNRTLAPPRDATQIIEDLHENRESLEHRRLLLLSDIDDLKDEAKALNKKGKKKEAIALMKRVQVKEKNVAHLDGQINNLEQAENAVQNTAISVDVANTMKDGSTAVKDLLQQVSVDDIQQTADDMAESIGQTGELMDALAMPMGEMALVDEDDMESQLAQWDQEEDEEKQQREEEIVIQQRQASPEPEPETTRVAQKV